MAGSIEPGGWQEWRQHWRIIIPCFLGVMLISTHGYALSVMILPLEQEFGWPRAQISAGYMIISIVALFGAPLVGNLVDKVGPRKIGLSGILLYCAMLASLSLATPNILSWWGLWSALAIGALTIMPAVWVAILNGYFFKSRGLAMAIALSGTGMGAALWPMITHALVDEFGWRMAYVGLGLIGASICLPVTWFLFREADAKPKPASNKNTAPAKQTRAGPTAKQQVHSLRFYKLAGAAVIFAFANGTLTQNMVPVLVSEGLTPAKAAAIAGLLGIGSITGRIVGGFLLDRFNGNIVAAVSVLLPILTVALLMGAEGSQIWAGAACLILGLSVGAELDCCAYLAGRHFGTRNFGTLFGSINGLLLFGTGIAPIAANYVFDTMHSYDLVLIALIPIFVLTAILFATLGDYRNLDQETGEPLSA